MREYRHSSHATYEIQYHFVWVTKYRYKVLTTKIAMRLRACFKSLNMEKNLIILYHIIHETCKI